MVTILRARSRTRDCDFLPRYSPLGVLTVIIWAMQTVVQRLPNGIEVLKSLVLKRTAENERYVCENQHFKPEVLVLQEQHKVLLAKRYGPSSEKLAPDQIQLCNETEEAVQAATEDEAAETVTVAGHARKKRGRKPLPGSLPRVRVEHELPEAEQTLACGCHLSRIGQALSEQLDIIPAGCRSPVCARQVCLAVRRR